MFLLFSVNVNRNEMEGNVRIYILRILLNRPRTIYLLKWSDADKDTLTCTLWQQQKTW